MRNKQNKDGQKQKNKFRIISECLFMILKDNKPVLVKTVFFYIKDSHIDQWNRVQSLKVEPLMWAIDMDMKISFKGTDKSF